MILKTPQFWYRDKGTAAPPLEKMLEPISYLYELGYRLHQNSRDAAEAGLPVLCIGNIVAGGTGKTPTALAIMDIIHKNSLAKKPFFLIRGYGGGEVGPLLTDPAKHTAWDTGDEALILSKAAPTIVAIDRIGGAELARRKGADLVLMDDGLQNPGIRKDIRIIVINGEMGFGNEKILPAGPLREPLETGIARADAFIFLGADTRGVRDKLPQDKPIFEAILCPAFGKLPPQDKAYIAFAGLGYPEKFFKFLKEDLRFNIVDTVKFSDHYPYNETDIRNLAQKAQTAGAELLTTEKDMMRIPAIEGITIYTLPIELAWSDEAALTQFLKDKLARLSS